MKVEFYLQQMVPLLGVFIAPPKYYECSSVLWWKLDSTFYNLAGNLPTYDKSLILIYIPIVF